MLIASLIVICCSQNEGIGRQNTRGLVSEDLQKRETYNFCRSLLAAQPHSTALLFLFNF